MEKHRFDQIFTDSTSWFKSDELVLKHPRRGINYFSNRNDFLYFRNNWFRTCTVWNLYAVLQLVTKMRRFPNIHIAWIFVGISCMNPISTSSWDSHVSDSFLDTYNVWGLHRMMYTKPAPDSSDFSHLMFQTRFWTPKTSVAFTDVHKTGSDSRHLPISWHRSQPGCYEHRFLEPSTQ